MHQRAAAAASPARRPVDDDDPRRAAAGERVDDRPRRAAGAEHARRASGDVHILRGERGDEPGTVGAVARQPAVADRARRC